MYRILSVYALSFFHEKMLEPLFHLTPTFIVEPPFFEKYKHEENFREYIKEYDKNLTLQELFAEMLAEVEKEGCKLHEDVTWFAVEPADYDEEIQNTLIDIIPDFHIRLKRNPKNN